MRNLYLNGEVRGSRAIAEDIAKMHVNSMKCEPKQTAELLKTEGWVAVGDAGMTKHAVVLV